jgi:hypothetical protein
MLDLQQFRDAYGREIDAKKPYRVFGVQQRPLTVAAKQQRQLIFRKEHEDFRNTMLSLSDDDIPHNVPMEGRDLVQRCGDCGFVPHFCGSFPRTARIILIPADLVVQREDAVRSRQT